MTHGVKIDLPAIRPAMWLGAAHRAAAVWYPRVLMQGRSLAERRLRGLQSFRLDRMPRIGRMSGIGLLLLTASGVLWLSTILPLARNVSGLEGEVARLEAATRAGAPAIRSQSGQVDAFMKRLPTRMELPAMLAVVVTQATDAGLELESGRYEFTPAKSGRIARYHLAFPVRGSYVQLRKFIDGTLGALPTVALEGLKFERASVGDELLDADLRFTVVVRNGS